MLAEVPNSTAKQRFETQTSWERQRILLGSLRLPGRLSPGDVAILLGVEAHDIPRLVAAKLLKPLGKPTPTARKWYASAEIEVLRQNPRFLAKATDLLAKVWRQLNSKKKARSVRSARGMGATAIRAK